VATVANNNFLYYILKDSNQQCKNNLHLISGLQLTCVSSRPRRFLSSHILLLLLSNNVTNSSSVSLFILLNIASQKYLGKLKIITFINPLGSTPYTARARNDSGTRARITKYEHAVHATNFISYHATRQQHCTHHHHRYT
jgi:hypothetical protein